MEPKPDAVRAQLERILASPEFAKSERTRSFMRYIVEETLAGRAERIKAYAIALAVFGRDEGFDPQADPIVRVEAGRLRRALERYYLLCGADDAVRIDVPVGGYVPTFSARRAELEPATEGADGTDEAGGALLRHRLRSTALRPVAGVLLVVVILVGSWTALTRGPAVAPSPPTAAAGPSLIVLPFDDLAGDPAQDGFARGLAAVLVRDLLRFEDVAVFSASVAPEWPGRGVPHGRSRQPDRGYAVTGSVQRSGASLRVNVQLINLRTGATIWAGTFDKDVAAGGVLEVQDEIAADVARTLVQPYGIVFRDALRTRPQEGLAPSAFDCVLATYEYRQELSRRSHAVVRDCLERSAEHQPTYGSLWALLALVYLDEYRFGYNPRPAGGVASASAQPSGTPEGAAQDPVELAHRAARRAVELAPDSALAFHALFNVQLLRGDEEEAWSAAERALAANPNNPEIWAIVGLRHALAGRWEKGVALVERAIAATATPPGWYHFPATLNHVRQDRYEEALRAARRIDLPEFPVTHAVVAAIHGQRGDADNAQRALARLRAVDPGFPARAGELLAIQIRDAAVLDRVLEGLRKAGLPVTVPPQS